MSAHENILKSLAVLEQNLKDIDTAKNQVSKVINSSADLAFVLDSYKSSFTDISKNLKLVISEIKSINIDTLSTLSKQTELLNNEVVKLSNLDFAKSFTAVKNETVKQFEKDLEKRLVILEDKTSKFDNQVIRLTEFDFTNSFKSIEQRVIEQFNKDLNSKLSLLENKATDLQSKIDDFKIEISRISAIDINAHFAKISSDLKEQNQRLLKETKINRLILIVGAVIIIGVIVLVRLM
jgi:hypothetical protein